MPGVRIAAVKKFAFLRQISEGAKNSRLSLKQTLLAAQSAVNSPSFKSGRIVVSQSGSGQSGSFQVGFPGIEWTQDNIFGLCEELAQMVEYRVSVGSTDDGDPDNTETLRVAIVDDYNAGLVPQFGMREQMVDVSMLNFPASNTR